jgi:hypothetical protein
VKAARAVAVPVLILAGIGADVAIAYAWIGDVWSPPYLTG